jgi:hypothetical protein
MTTRRIAGVAGLVYAAAAAIENMGLLEAPTLASPVADVRALYEDQALAVVTSLAGAVELLAYCVFAVPLFGLLREREPRGEGWSFLALAGGVARPVVAAAGLVATAVLVADVGAGLGDDAVATLFDLSLTARMLSGGFLALFMAGVGLSALRSRALPSWLALYACAAALPPAIAPVAAFAAEHAVQVAAWIAFSLQALWIFLAGFWLTSRTAGAWSPSCVAVPSSCSSWALGWLASQGFLDPGRRALGEPAGSRPHIVRCEARSRQPAEGG